MLLDGKASQGTGSGRARENEEMDKTLAAVRLDKWLWAARFFKTRSLAAKACELGRIEVNGVLAKPAREVKPGDTLAIRTEAGRYVVEVLGLSEMRGPAPVAQQLYAETEESRAARTAAAEEKKLLWNQEGYREGRPTKQERRAINKLRGRIIPFR